MKTSFSYVCIVAYWFLLGMSTPTARAVVLATGDVTPFPEPNPRADWNAGGGVTVGSTGAGSLVITSGSQVASADSMLGSQAGSHGQVTVSDDGSSWRIQTSVGTERAFYIGYAGNGELLIEKGGGVVNRFDGEIGYLEDSWGKVMVTGAGSTWLNSEDDAGGLRIGGEGEGELIIENGGFSGGWYFSYIGNRETGMGQVIVTGVDSEWQSGDLHVGRYGLGELTISDGGFVDTKWDGTIGRYEGAYGKVTVTGAGSEWIASNISVYRGELAVTEGGGVQGSLAVDYGGKVLISGEGSEWSGFDLEVGHNQSGELIVSNGAEIRSGAWECHIGYQEGSQGRLIVTGAGSRWTHEDDIHIGFVGGGSELIIAQGATVEVSGDIYLGDRDVSNDNTLSVDGTLMAGNVHIGSPQGLTGNVMKLEAGATFTLEAIYLHAGNSLSIAGNLGGIDGLLAYLGGSALRVQYQDAWVTVDSGNAHLISITFEAGYTQVAAEADPAEGFLQTFFGDDLYVFPDTIIGESAWYWSYTFKSFYYFAGGNWVYFFELNGMAYIAENTGTVDTGFWAYFMPEWSPGYATWAYLADFTVDESSGDPMSAGYLFCQEPVPGDSGGAAWYFFSEYPDGNWMINIDHPGEWHRVR